MLIRRGRGCNLTSSISHLEECLGPRPFPGKKQAQGPGLRLHFDPTFIVLLQYVVFGLETACD